MSTVQQIIDRFYERYPEYNSSEYVFGFTESKCVIVVKKEQILNNIECYDYKCCDGLEIYRTIKNQAVDNIELCVDVATLEASRRTDVDYNNKLIVYTPYNYQSSRHIYFYIDEICYFASNLQIILGDTYAYYKITDENVYQYRYNCRIWKKHKLVEGKPYETILYNENETPISIDILDINTNRYVRQIL